MRYVADALSRARRADRPDVRLSVERNMSCGVGLCGHCQLREYLVCVDGPVFALDRVRTHARHAGAVMATQRRRSRGRSWRSGSSPAATAASSPCSTARTSCSRSPGAVEIAYFPEATRAVVEGPYDVSLVEGSITTPADPSGSSEVRAASRRLVTIGACATAGGIQALRNFADVAEFTLGGLRAPGVHRDPRALRPRSPPTSRSTSSCAAARSTGASCWRCSRPTCSGASPGSPRRASAWSASGAGNVCVTVAHGTPCLGPVTHAGCGALCPSYDRGCYGCFGPADTTNTVSLAGGCASSA